MSATSGSPFFIRYTTHPAEISRLDISLSSQARLHLEKFGNHSPNETPGSVLALFHTDDSCVGKPHWTPIGTACQQERRQTLEMRKMAHNDNIICINVKEICDRGGILRRIQSGRVTGPGSTPYCRCQYMRRLLGAFLTAVLYQRNGDSQT